MGGAQRSSSVTCELEYPQPINDSPCESDASCCTAAISIPQPGKLSCQGEGVITPGVRWFTREVDGPATPLSIAIAAVTMIIYLGWIHLLCLVAVASIWSTACRAFILLALASVAMPLQLPGTWRAFLANPVFKTWRCGRAWRCAALMAAPCCCGGCDIFWCSCPSCLGTLCFGEFLHHGQQCAVCMRVLGSDWLLGLPSSGSTLTSRSSLRSCCLPTHSTSMVHIPCLEL